MTCLKPYRKRVRDLLFPFSNPNYVVIMLPFLFQDCPIGKGWFLKTCIIVKACSNFPLDTSYQMCMLYTIHVLGMVQYDVFTLQIG